MSNWTNHDKLETSQEFINYYNILTGNHPGTPQTFSLDESSAKTGLGRTLDYEERDYEKDFVKKVILFKESTYEDLKNRTGGWPNLQATGSITSLKLKTRGLPLPDITTEIFAKGKNVNTIRDEMDAVYIILYGLEGFLDDVSFENTTPSEVLRGFFDYQYGINKRSSRLVHENRIHVSSGARVPVEVIWQEGSKADKKRYGRPTNYLEIFVKTQAYEKTSSVLRINNLNPLSKIDEVLGRHLTCLQPVYESISK
ncbi:Uncharacterised protein [uncultured archaeon]|nr:Uncharacterised protein [uncultured archaeon]